jgi:hypothetical protein
MVLTDLRSRAGEGRRLAAVRRLGALLAAATLALGSGGCAAPEIRLRARFVPGEVRDYRLVSDARVEIAAAGTATTQRTRLEATTRIAVERVEGGVATVLLTISPRRLVRDGRAAEPPAEQRLRLRVAPDGRVVGVETAEAVPVALGAADAEDLVALIGPPLPPGRVRLASRWRRVPVGEDGRPAGLQEARLAALRVEQGRDCAIVALSTRRPVVREREISGTMLRLQGTEYAAGEMAFAFREGFPVRLGSDAEARLAIASGLGQGGSVVIRTTTALELASRRAPARR